MRWRALRAELAPLRTRFALFVVCSLLYCGLCLAATPRITRIEPAIGSPLGGTLVTVFGENLPSPADESFAGVFIGDSSCAGDVLASTPWRIVCVTSPHAASSPLNVSVVTNDGLAACGGNCSFTYSIDAMSTISLVSPRAGRSGDTLTLAGDIQAFMDHNVEVSIAGTACALTDAAGNLLSSVNAPYLPFTPSSPLSCTIPPIAAGEYNITLNVASQGNAVPRDTALRTSGGTSLFMYEHLARVDAISPAVVSVAGGAVMTINGTGFSLNADENVVTFGGVPGTVTFSTNSQLLVTVPDLSAVNVDATCTTAVNGTQLRDPAAGIGSVVPGSRGALLQIWYGNTSDASLNVTAMKTFPSAPNKTAYLDEFDATSVHGLSNSSFFRMSTVFVAPSSGTYSFVLSCDGKCTLWFGDDLKAAPASRLIASTAVPTGYRVWDASMTQTSSVLTLKAGSSYYLEVQGQGGYVSVGAVLHRALFNNKDTDVAVDEVQELVIGYDALQEVQVVHVSNPGSGTWSLKLNGGVATVPALATESEVAAAVESLFDLQCSVTTDPAIRYFEAFTFEAGANSTEDWTGGVASNARVSRPAYCGRYGITVVQDEPGPPLQHDFVDGVSFGTGVLKPGFDVTTYSVMCMAYRIPNTTSVSIVIDVAGIGERSIKLTTDLTGLTPPPVATWPLVVDGHWHHGCIDLGSQLRDSLFADGINLLPKNRVLSMRFASPNAALYPTFGDFAIDEFSVTSLKRVVARIPSQINNQEGFTFDAVNGFMLDHVQVSKSNDTNSTVQEYSYTITFTALNCDVGLPLFGVVEDLLIAPPTSNASATVDVTRKQAASERLSGRVELSMLGSQWANVDVAASATAMLAVIRALGTVGEDVTVTRTGTCGERRWQTTFHDLKSRSGSLPLLLSRFVSSATGYNKRTSVSKLVEAHELLVPLPGSSVLVPSSLSSSTCNGFALGKPAYQRNFSVPVQVVVNDRVASCAVAGNPNCSLPFNNVTYPIALSIIPTSVSPRSRNAAAVNLTITGTSFGASVKVLIGAALCPILSLQTQGQLSRIVCAYPPSTGGNLSVTVVDPVLGTSAGHISLVSGIQLQSVTPRNVSFGGGTLLSLTLYGASSDARDIAVTVNTTVVLSAIGHSAVSLFIASSCAVVAALGDFVSCIIDPFPFSTLSDLMELKGLTDYNVTVNSSSISVKQFGLTSSVLGAIAYDYTVTPILSSVSPNSGPSYGGTVITIAGAGFNCSEFSTCSVLIGKSPCIVTVASDTLIQCTTTAHASGFVPVVVNTATGFALAAATGVDSFRYFLRIDVIAPALSDEVFPALVFSVTPTISVTPSRTSSTSFTPTHSRTPSVTPTTSPSNSGSRTLTPSRTGSVSLSSSQTVSVTISITKSTTKSPSISASSTNTPFQNTLTPTRSPTKSVTSSPTVSVSDSKSATDTASRSGTRSSTRTSTVSSSVSSTTSISGTVTQTCSLSLSASTSPSLSASPSPSSWAPVVGMGGDVELDLSGQGFGNASFLASTAMALGLSQQQAATRVNALLFEPVIDSFTIATTAFDANNPLHPVISDVQVVSLLSADKTYEIQQIQIISPNNTGGTFNISTADGKKTTQSMVFLANATTMYDAITTLNLAPDIEVSYTRVRDANGTDNVTWVVTFLALAPVDPVVLNTQDLLFSGVQYSVTRLRRGVVPFSGTWTASVPQLGSSVSVPIQYNASADDVRLALLNVSFPTVYGSLEVFSVDRTETHGDPSDFQGAGSTMWTWTIVTILHPFEGIDPNGRLPSLTLNGSGFVGGFGVALLCNHSVIGQAGWRAAHGSYTAISDSNGDTVSLNTTLFSYQVAAVISSLSGVVVLDVQVVTSGGWGTNDYGYGTESGYGIGLTDVLDGLGAASTIFVLYVPANAVDVCTSAGVMTRGSSITFDGNGLLGTNITWTQKTLQHFRCNSLAMPVHNHTDTNLRVRLPPLKSQLLSLPAQYGTLIGAPQPAGWWRSLSRDVSTGSAGPLVTNIGTFDVDVKVVGSAVPFPGFSARDADPAVFLGGSSYVEVPYRGIFNEKAFTLEMWLRPESVAVIQVIALSSYLPDVLYHTSNGYGVFIDPCGTISAWLATGNSTFSFLPGSRLLEALTKDCVGYTADVSNAAFPWTVVTSGVVAVGEWSHVAVAYSDSNRVFSVLINGQLANQARNVRSYLANDIAPLTIGGSVQQEVTVQAISGFAGAVDEIAYFTEILPFWYMQQRVAYGLEVNQAALINVNVLGQTSQCRFFDTWPLWLAQSNCIILLSGPQTPLIYAATPSSASVGDVVTLAGDHLTSTTSLITLYLNNVSIPVMASSAAEIQFVVPDLGGQRGALNVTVHITGVGWAVGFVQFVSVVKIQSFTPSLGSIAGGVSIAISGGGFSVTPGAMTVTLGSTTSAGPASDNICYLDNDVPVTSASFACIPTQSIEGFYELKIHSQSPQQQASMRYPGFQCLSWNGCLFEFALRRTPVVNGFTPTSATGDTIVTVFGVSFSNVWSNMRVFVGAVECPVISIFDASVLTFNVQNVYSGLQNLTVRVAGWGNAVGRQALSDGIFNNTVLRDRRLPMIDIQPVMVSTSPSKAALGGGITVTISGAGLIPASMANDSLTPAVIAGTRVSLASTLCDVTAITVNTVTCTLREHSPISAAFDAYANGQAIGSIPTSIDTSDNFGANAWRFGVGGPLTSWLVLNGMLSSDSSKSANPFSSCGCRSPAFVTFGQSDWQDLEVTARVWMTSTASFGIGLRALSTLNVGGNATLWSHYRFFVSAFSKCIQLEFIDNNANRVVLASQTLTSIAIPPQQWLVIAASIVGDKFTGSINGVVMLQASVNSDDSPAGVAALLNCGFGTYLVSNITTRFIATQDAAGSVGVPRPYLPNGGVARVSVSQLGKQIGCASGATASFTIPASRTGGSAASVQSTSGCSFQFSAVNTPQILSHRTGIRSADGPYLVDVLPSLAGILVIQGVGFPANSGDVRVFIGATPCVVDVAAGYSTAFLQCSHPPLASGTYFLRIRSVTYGDPQTPANFDYSTANSNTYVVVVSTGVYRIHDLSAVSVGSVAGGKNVTFSATGPSLTLSENIVTVCNVTCVPFAVSTSQLQCEMAALDPRLARSELPTGPITITRFASDSASNASGSVVLNAPVLTLSAGSSLVLVFPAIDVARGSSIVEANIVLTSVASNQQSMVNASVSAYWLLPGQYLSSLSASPFAFAVPPVYWSLLPWRFANETHVSTDLASVVQAVVSTGSWKPGYSLALVLSSNNASETLPRAFRGVSQSFDVTSGPLLTIRYQPQSFSDGLFAADTRVSDGYVCPVSVTVRQPCSITAASKLAACNPSPVSATMARSVKYLSSSSSNTSTLARVTQVVDGSASSVWPLSVGAEDIVVDLQTAVWLNSIVVSWQNTTQRLWTVSASDSESSEAFEIARSSVNESSSTINVRGWLQTPRFGVGSCLNSVAVAGGRYLRFRFMPSSSGSPGVISDIAVTACNPPAAAADVLTQSFNETLEKVVAVCNVSGVLVPLDNHPACAPADQSNALLNVTVDCPAVSVALASTPRLLAVSPAYGSAYGGDRLKVFLSGFPTPIHYEDGSAAVLLGGAPCIVDDFTVNETYLECVTTVHPADVAPVSVAVALGDRNAAVVGDVGFQYVGRWSDRRTWSGFGYPAHGDNVTIPFGTTVMLDVTGVVLDVLTVRGVLLVEDVADLELTVGRLVIDDGGRVAVGTAPTPHMHKLAINVIGDAQPWSVYAGSVAVLNGTLEMFGSQQSAAWSRLASPATGGSASFTLSSNLHWQVGDKGFVTGSNSGFQADESEMFVVQSVSSDGLTLSVAPALKHSHVGGPVTIGGRSLYEFSSVVGKLSRNIVLRGDNWFYDQLQRNVSATVSAWSDVEEPRLRRGSALVVQPRTVGSAALRLSGVEFVNFGDAVREDVAAITVRGPPGELSQPLSGTVRGSFVRRCSLHVLSGRGIELYKTVGFYVSDNIVMDGYGSGIVLESGEEEWNTIQANFVSTLRPTVSHLQTDTLPSGILAKNPSNVVIGNVAHGIVGFGISLDVSTDVFVLDDGTTRACPGQARLGVFSGNTAFGNRIGVSVRGSSTPQAWECSASSTIVANITSTVAFRNALAGVSVENMEPVLLRGLLVADNGAVNLEILSALNSIQDSNHIISVRVEDAFVSSTIDAVARVNPNATVAIGVSTPAAHGLRISGITFANFNTANAWAVGACSRCEVFAPNDGGFSSYFAAVTWTASPNRRYWRWAHEGGHIDSDGSFGGAGASFVAFSPLLAVLPGCVTDTSSGGFARGLACIGYQLQRLAVNAVVPLQEAPMTVSNLLNPGNVSVVPFGRKRLTHPGGFVWLGTANQTYRLDFGYDVTSFSFDVSTLSASDWVILRPVFNTNLSRISLSVNGKSFKTAGPPDINGTLPVGTWYFDEVTRTATFVLKSTSGVSPAGSLLSIPCTVENGCLPSPVQTAPVVFGYKMYWSNYSTWFAMGQNPPDAGQNVTILPGFVVILDQVTPVLAVLRVQGTLIFDDSRGDIELVLKASHIIVTGGLFIGDINSPFPNAASIRLFGDRSAMNATLSGVNLGSKVLAVFGTLRICGKTVERTWTQLVSTASVGDNALLVRGQLAWSPGQQILVASSSFNPDEAETLTIAAVSWMNEGVTRIQTVERLAFRHISEQASQVNRTHRIETEVALLSRSVNIVSGESADEAVIVVGQQPTYNATITQEYGSRLMIVGGVLPDLSADYPANVSLQYVGFVGFGQANVTRGSGIEVGAPGFLRPPRDPEPVVIQGCSFQLGLHGAIAVREIIKEVQIVDNVIVRPKRVGVFVEPFRQASPHAVVHNLVVNLQMPTEYVVPWRDPQLWDLAVGDSPFSAPASFQIVSSALRTFTLNAAAGSQFGGIVVEPEPCGSAPIVIDNFAHSCALGFVLTANRTGSSPPECSMVNTLTGWRNYEYGVYSYASYTLQHWGLTLVGNTVGLFSAVFGPSAVTHGTSSKYVSVNSSIFAAEPQNTNCAVLSPQAFRFPWSWGSRMKASISSRVGIVIPDFISEGPKSLLSAPPHETSGYPAVDGATLVFDTVFSGFSPRCGQNPVAIAANPLALDASHSVQLLRTVNDNSTGQLLFGNSYPMASSAQARVAANATLAVCPLGGCDADNHRLVNDVDGSLFGTSGPVSYFSAPRNISTVFKTSRLGKKLKTAFGFLNWNLGVARNDSCATLASQQAIRCPGVYRTLAVESFDADSVFPHLFPVALATTTSAGLFVDKLNGPANHEANCAPGAECPVHLSTAFGVVQTGAHYYVVMNGTEPQTLRLSLLNAAPTESIVVHVYYEAPQLLEVFINETFVPDINFNGTEPILWTQPNYTTLQPFIGAPNGMNTFDPAAKVISVTITSSVPVDIKMTPVLRILMELAGAYDTLLAERAEIRADLADALNISASSIRFVNSTQGSLVGTAYVTVDIEPPEFNCSIPEHSMLSYCTNLRRRLTVVEYAMPLMTQFRLDELYVVLSRLNETAYSGELQTFISYTIVKADVTFPPPIALADPSLEVTIPVVLLRSGTFGFRDLEVVVNATDEEVTVWVDRIGSAFGVAMVGFTTVDGTARAAQGGYETVTGMLQFQPYETTLPITVPFRNSLYFYWPRQNFSLTLTSVSPDGLSFIDYPRQNVSVTVISESPPVYIKFQQEQTVLYPTAGIVNIPVERVGSLGLTSYFFVKTVNHTTAGIIALPDFHYTSYPAEGQRYAIGIGVQNRTIPFEILPQALEDLTALRKERGVPDSVFEVELVLFDSLNALIPESHDLGQSIKVLITLEGRPPVKSRLGELNTFAITFSCIVVVLTVAWYWRQYRKAQKRQRKEERPLVHNILTDATMHTIVSAPDQTPGKQSRTSSTFSLLRSRRKDKVVNSPMTGDYLFSPTKNDDDSLMGKSLPGPSDSDGGSSAAGPSLGVPTLSLQDTNAGSSLMGGSDSVGVHVASSLPTTVDASLHMRTLSARSGAGTTAGGTGSEKGSPSRGTVATQQSPLRSNHKETPHRTPTAASQPTGSPVKSRSAPKRRPPSAQRTPRRTPAAVAPPPPIEVDGDRDSGYRSSSLSPELQQPSFPRSPHSHAETTVLSPGGVSLFGTAHMVAHNARVRQLRSSGKTGGDSSPV